MAKNKGGRPLKYKNSVLLLEKAYGFFDKCKEDKQLPEKAGLCLYLGINKDTLAVWRKDKRFSSAIKELDAMIESAWVKRLNGMAATGAIFYLKNAFKEDYKDRSENNPPGSLIISFDPKIKNHVHTNSPR